LRDSFYKCFGVSSTEPGPSLEIRMAEFYEAEKSALGPGPVRDSFASVGLYPYDKNLILKNCRENSPVGSEPDENPVIDDLARKICMYSEDKRDEIELLRSTVKHAKPVTLKKTKRRQRAEKQCGTIHAQDDARGTVTSHGKSMPDATEQPKKRAKLMHVDRKTCASEGCQKTHCWSKKWVFCQKCNKNFCEEHQDELYHHQC